MRSREDKIDDNTINIITAILAGILLVSPWLLGFITEVTPSYSTWIGGALIGLVAIAALAELHAWEEWVNFVLGLCVAIAPWVLGFPSLASAMWAHVIIGLAVAGLAALEIWRLREPPTAGAV
jgi:hypothetical protein